MENHKSTSAFGGYFTKKLLINLCIMAAIGFILIWIALMWLDIWTDHGKYAVVPDLKGLNYYEACDRLKTEGFTAELNDSVYDSSSKPGTVLDQAPQTGAKVKYGREIYLTINAFSPKTVKLPQIIDVSERQARALLQGVGLNNISVVSVESDYKGLVVGARSGGRRIAAGTRLSVSAPIILEVGSGAAEPEPVITEERPGTSEEEAEEAVFNLDF